MEKYNAKRYNGNYGQPDCNSGRGMIKASRSIRGRWCSMVVLIAVAAMLAVCIVPALATHTSPDPANLANTTGNYQAGGE